MHIMHRLETEFYYYYFVFFSGLTV